MEFKGTKGEWRIASKNKEKQFYVIHGKDQSIGSREVQVCNINYGFHPAKEQLNVTEANAKLIAAAPELLEALQNMLSKFEKVNPMFGDNEIQEAKKAIEKALNNPI